MKQAIGIAAVAVLIFAAPVIAADIGQPIYKLPPAATSAPTYTWTGFYIGLDGGGAWSRQSVSDVTCSTCVTFPASGTITGSGFIGGVYAGYNFMIAPTWLVGIEGDWSWAHLSDTATALQVGTAGGVFGAPFGSAWSHDAQWLATLRGRIGFAPSPTILFYMTGGAAWSKIDYSAQDVFTPLGCANGNCGLSAFSQTKAGYVIGAGGEWAPWSNNWILRVEYLYYHFDGAGSSVNFQGAFAANYCCTFNWADLSIHEVRGGLSYKF